MLKRSASSVFSFIFSPVPIVTVQLSVEQCFNNSSISLYCIGVNPVNPSSIILAPFIKLLSFIYFTSMSGISSVLIYLSFVYSIKLSYIRLRSFNLCLKLVEIFSFFDISSILSLLISYW